MPISSGDVRKGAAVVFAALLAGSLINLAVALACTLWSPAGSSTPVEMRGRGEWLEPASEEWPEPPTWFHRSSGFGIWYDSVSIAQFQGNPLTLSTPGGLGGEGTLETHEAGRVLAGWPWPALACQRRSHLKYEGDLAKMPTIPPAEWSASIPVQAAWTAEPPPTFSARVVPLTPRLPGFVFNSLLYACLLLGLLVAHRLVRRRWRRCKGLCVVCGYEIGELQACPECGQDSPHSSRSRSIDADRSRHALP